MHSSKQAKFKSRIGYGVTAALLTLGLSACAGPTNPRTAAVSGPSQALGSQGTAQDFRFGIPVESESHALIAAEAGLGTGFNYSKPLTVVSVERTSYGDYIKRMGGGSDRPADMKIWLVIYVDDEWQSIASRPGVTPSPPFHGCVAVVINAADGLPLEISGPVEKGERAECGT